MLNRLGKDHHAEPTAARQSDTSAPTTMGIALIVEQYWAGIARRLQIESGVFNQLIPHNLERGMQNELTLARMLASFLPPDLGVGSGIVFDHLNQQSRQMDIVLFDRARQPQLLAQTNQVLFPVEMVRAVLEVKTTLSSRDIEIDFPRKKESIASLEPLPGFAVPQVALFAYSFADSAFGRASELCGLSQDERPDIACIVEPGFVVRSDGSAGFTPKIDSSVDVDDEPSWLKPEDGSADVVMEGDTYPVYMLGQYQGERYVGDPGRALLMFCLDLLESLAADREYAWLRSYGSPTMHSLQEI